MYTIFQNDEAIQTAHTLEEAAAIAKSFIQQAKNKNISKGMNTLRPSQYVYIYKFIQEFTE